MDSGSAALPILIWLLLTGTVLAVLPAPLFFRSVPIPLGFVGIWPLVLFKSENPFQIATMPGMWTIHSELVAAFVAWQVVRGGSANRANVSYQSGGRFESAFRDGTSISSETASKVIQHPLDEVVLGTVQASHKIAYVIAGISATLALLLVPVILCLASELNW